MTASLVSKKRIRRGLWWQQSLVLVRGCTEVSEGCRNCWARSATAVRMLQTNTAVRNMYQGLVAQDGRSCSRWSGRIRTVPGNLDQIRTKRPTVWAVQNDLFHPDVPEHFITNALTQMYMQSHHVFVIMTKRPQRMLDWWRSDWAAQVRTDNQHMWFAVSAEDQETADQRVPLLVQMESAKRMLSLEPLLGPIDLLRCGAVTQSSTPSPTGLEVAPYDYVNANVYFITTGGESGPTARPALPYNVSNIVDVCSQLQIPLFFSGWGEWLPDGQKAPSEGSMRRALIRQADEESLRMVRPNPSGSVQGWTRVWNKHSGRMIDGIEWTELPWLTT